MPLHVRVCAGTAGAEPGGCAAAQCPAKGAALPGGCSAPAHPCTPSATCKHKLLAVKGRSGWVCTASSPEQGDSHSKSHRWLSPSPALQPGMQCRVKPRSGGCQAAPGPVQHLGAGHPAAKGTPGPAQHRGAAGSRGTATGLARSGQLPESRGSLSPLAPSKGHRGFNGSLRAAPDQFY